MWTSSWLLFLPLIVNQAFAQDISSLPQCGQNCFNVAFNEFSRSCPTRDAACLCSQPGFNPEITSCTSQQCVVGTDNNITLTFLQSYCAPTNQSISLTSSNPTTVVSLTTSSSLNVSESVTLTQPSITGTAQIVDPTGGSGTASSIVATRTSNAGVTIGGNSYMVPVGVVMSLLSVMFSL